MRIRSLGRFLRIVIVLCAVAFVAEMAVAFFGIPDRLMDWISGREFVLVERPHYIVVLGGGGMPSGTGLMRTYYAADYGAACTGATFIVCLPASGVLEDSSVAGMRDELVMRGVPASSILMESRGVHTHEQAVNVRRMLGREALNRPLLIVTSSYHIRRSVLCFLNEGFTKVGGLPAWNRSAEDDPGAESAPSRSPLRKLRTKARYTFWIGLQGEVLIARELCAMLVYRLRGWI